MGWQGGEEETPVGPAPRGVTARSPPARSRPLPHRRGARGARTHRPRPVSRGGAPGRLPEHARDLPARRARRSRRRGEPRAPAEEALDCVARQLQGAAVPVFDGRDASLSRRLLRRARHERPRARGYHRTKRRRPPSPRRQRRFGPVAALIPSTRASRRGLQAGGRLSLSAASLRALATRSRSSSNSTCSARSSSSLIDSRPRSAFLACLLARMSSSSLR